MFFDCAHTSNTAAFREASLKAVRLFQTKKHCSNLWSLPVVRLSIQFRILKWYGMVWGFLPCPYGNEGLFHSPSSLRTFPVKPHLYITTHTYTHACLTTKFFRWKMNNGWKVGWRQNVMLPLHQLSPAGKALAGEKWPYSVYYIYICKAWIVRPSSTTTKKASHHFVKGNSESQHIMRCFLTTHQVKVKGETDRSSLSVVL